MYICRWMQQSSSTSDGDISLTTSKDGIILINYLHLSFRPFNCLKFEPIIKTNIKSICPMLHILMNTFRQMRLNYEYFSFRETSHFRHSNKMPTTKASCKNFWWKYINNENCKTCSGNKEQKAMFQLFLHWICTLVLSASFLRARLGELVTLCTLKIEHD